MSILTSAFSLSLSNIVDNVTARLEEKKEKMKNEEFEFTLKIKIQYYIKCMAVFLPHSLFKILAGSILGVFFNDFFFIFIIVSYWIVLMVCLLITDRRYNLFEEKDVWGQFVECFSLSWLTITNLGRGKSAAVLRLVSSIFWTVAHTINLPVILIICNTDPGIMDDKRWSAVVWSELSLVQDLSTLNTLLITILCLGWGSLVLDVITTGVKHYWAREDTEEEEETSFWDGAILMEGYKYNLQCCHGPAPREARGADTNVVELMRISSSSSSSSRSSSSARSGSVSRSRSSWDSEEEEEQSRTKEPISDDLSQHTPIMELVTSHSSSVVDEQDNASRKTITVDTVLGTDSLNINTLPRPWLEENRTP